MFIVLFAYFCLAVSFSNGQAIGATPPPLPYCNVTADCATGCACVPQILDFCADVASLTTELEKCSSCTAESGCEVGDFCVINPPGAKTGHCASCALPAAAIASARCAKDGIAAAPTPSAQEPDPTPSPESDPPCVETSWIENNGLEAGIWEKYGDARVLCVGEDLPCGTPGHLLRVCADKGCELKTYAEVCASTPDCIESMKPVSRLRHNFDWSEVRSSGCPRIGSIELTSVSQNINAGLYAPSRIIALVANSFNRNGFGFICDAVLAFESFSAQVSKILLASVQSSDNY